jgi:hypothetical protein
LSIFFLFGDLGLGLGINYYLNLHDLPIINMTDFFIFIIKNIKTDSIYVGLSKSKVSYFDPTKFLIEQHEKNGNYDKFAESYYKYKKANHIFSKINKEGFYSLTKEQAVAKRDKLIKFYRDNNRSLNDAPIETNLNATIAELSSL